MNDTATDVAFAQIKADHPEATAVTWSLSYPKPTPYDWVLFASNRPHGDKTPDGDPSVFFEMLLLLKTKDGYYVCDRLFTLSKPTLQTLING